VSDEFYIGYEPEMPPQLARRLRRVAPGLVALAVLMAAVLVSTENRFAPGVFEFGRVRQFGGHIVEFPYPALMVDGGGTGVTSWYWLVGPGKHGAADLVRGRDGQRVRLSGSLIQRDGDAMIEVVPDSLVMSTSSGVREPYRSRGAVTVEGEIVDSKCHLGVMKPGEGPTHRDCAVRCLLGRIPPMFVPHDRAGLGRVSLVSSDGRAFVGADLFAGRRVSVRGEILQRGTQQFLAVSRSDVRLIE
jgi:hypothetical protein